MGVETVLQRRARLKILNVARGYASGFFLPAALLADPFECHQEIRRRILVRPSVSTYQAYASAPGLTRALMGDHFEKPHGQAQKESLNELRPLSFHHFM